MPKSKNDNDEYAIALTLRETSQSSEDVTFINIVTYVFYSNTQRNTCSNVQSHW